MPVQGLILGMSVQMTEQSRKTHLPALIIIVISLIVFFSVEAASFFLTYTLEHEENFPYARKTSYAEFKSVDFKIPEPGRPCTVTSEISLEQAGTGSVNAEIAKVLLVYYIDSKAESAVLMNLGEDGKWMADIPGQKKGTRVTFYIYVLDTNGNVTSGAVPFENEIVSIPPMPDDPEGKIPDTLDIMEFAAGYDNEFLYVRFRTRGGFSEDITETPDTYGIRISNPKSDINHETLFSERIWQYYPSARIYYDSENNRKYFKNIKKERELAQNNGDSKMMDFWNATEYSLKTGMFFFDASQEASYSGGKVFPQGNTDGNMFTGKVALSQIGLSRGDSVRLLLMAMRKLEYASEDEVGLDLYDCTHYLVLNLSNYSYVVN